MPCRLGLLFLDSFPAAEYKLGTVVSFAHALGADTKLQGDYTANNLILGLSYHFAP
jgi:hypothetical protein